MSEEKYTNYRGGIYKWTNLITKEVLVGQSGSTVGFKKRKAGYLYCLRKGNYGNAHFQRNYNKYGEAVFLFEELEYIPIKKKTFEEHSIELTLHEQAWLDYYRDLGPVFNEIGPVNAPRRGSRHSQEAKEKMSKIQKQRMASPEVRAEIAKINTGKKQSKETKNKRAQKAIGRKHTSEAKEKMSAARKHHPPLTEEARKRMSISASGKKQSPEVIAKRVAATLATKARKKEEGLIKNGPKPEIIKKKQGWQNKDKKCSEETKAKMRAAQANRKPITEEARARMSASQKAYNAKKRQAKEAERLAAEEKKKAAA